MFEEITAVQETAGKKVKLLKEEPVKYMILAFMGGLFVGLGVMLAGTAGGMLQEQPYAKLVMGFAFTVALSLIVVAGGELFTGNNFVMSMGAFSKRITYGQMVKVWIACYIGNWLGSVVASVLFVATGSVSDEVGAFIVYTAAAKMAIPPLALFVKGILCNVLVCLATWCTYRCKSEVAKLIMIFWCVFTFYVCGFEHSVANMTYLTVGLLKPLHDGITIAGYFYNIFIATVGNIVGGALFLALPYYVIGTDKK